MLKYFGNTQKFLCLKTPESCCRRWVASFISVVLSLKHGVTLRTVVYRRAKLSSEKLMIRVLCFLRVQ